MSAALKLPMAVQIPTPSITLGTVGMAQWKKAITDFDGWQEHELNRLNQACVLDDEVARLTDEIDLERDHKKKRQLRADRRSAMAESRRQWRELSLSTRPDDSRPSRIPGRYS